VVDSDGDAIGSSGRRVKGSLTSRGYLQTTGVNKKKLLMHRIVANAWYGEHAGMEVNHLDGDRTNNAPNNLRFEDAVSHKQTDAERRREHLIAECRHA
tara:strand:+ start:1404 stop:1697 length:294 start_codon:yes stop_codon:yes gene_type:complete